MTIYIPYTYLIGWSETNQYYYGVRYANGKKGVAHPSDLFKSYFTSSVIVAEYIKEHGEPDIIQVRQTFRTKKEALDWETKVLQRLNAKYHSRMLNDNNNTPNGFTTKGFQYSEDSRKLMSQKGKDRYLTHPNPFKGKTHSEETKAMWSEERKGTTTYYNTLTGKNQRAKTTDPRIADGILVKLKNAGGRGKKRPTYKRVANPITTSELCSYDCGQVAKYINKMGKLMCTDNVNQCPVVHHNRCLAQAKRNKK